MCLTEFLGERSSSSLKKWIDEGASGMVSILRLPEGKLTLFSEVS